MTTSSSPPGRESGSQRPGNGVGLALLFLALASLALGCLALVGYWIRRLGRGR